MLKDLQGINETKEQTNVAIRALIRDLHRSPIGRHGLAEAIESFAIDSSKGSSTSIATDVVDVSLPPPIQLLIYQIAREGAMNALKHAGAGNIWISLREHDDGVELQIRDDGKGFDTDAPPPEGHFGSVMMRERALVAGGTFAIRSEAGRGTIISATFPRVWVEEGTLLESFVQPTAHDGTEPLTAPSEDSDQRSRRLLGRFRPRGRDAAPVTAAQAEAATSGVTAGHAGGKAEATTVEASAIETLGQQVSPRGEPDSDSEQADRDRRAVRT